MDRRFEEVEELGRAIHACVQQAELERADDLVEQRQNCLRRLFADPELDRGESRLADWVQAMLRQDRALLDDLAKLRERMQVERGDLRKLTRSALAYADTERG